MTLSWPEQARSVETPIKCQMIPPHFGLGLLCPEGKKETRHWNRKVSGTDFLFPLF